MSRPETTRITVLDEEEQRNRDEEWRAERDARRAAKEAASGLLPARSRGRPPWTRQLFEERLAQAVAATPAPRTEEAIASNFRGLSQDGSVGIDPDSLARLRRRHKRGGLPE